MSDQLTRESDNDTQAELAAWELLKEAREERDKAQALARELREACELMIIGICAAAIPHSGERATASLAVSEARKALTNAREVLP
jgi:predicted translin family RNA/ssDNA-binding protein